MCYSVTKHLYENNHKMCTSALTYILTQSKFLFSCNLFMYVRVQVISSAQRKREMNQRIYSVVFEENFSKNATGTVVF